MHGLDGYFPEPIVLVTLKAVNGNKHYFVVEQLFSVSFVLLVCRRVPVTLVVFYVYAETYRPRSTFTAAVIARLHAIFILI